MKRLSLRSSLSLCLLLSFAIFSQAKTDDNKTVVVAYVTSSSDIMPDPSVMTHINYAFGRVNETFDGVVVDNPDRLSKIVALKKEAKDLKVMLSVGGWGSGRFSEMASSKKTREAFAKDCRRVVKDYGLDGIDIDWEYPTQGGAGISSSPRDSDNFTLLMASLRKALGKKKLLTAATVCSAQYIIFKDCLKYLDFVNVMSYDMGDPPKHHSALYPSGISGYYSASQAVQAHLSAGVPPEKLVMGMPFYGRGSHDGPLRNFGKTHCLYGGYSDNWSEESKVPFVADSTGALVLGYENPRSLAEKCQYVIDNHLRGGMYWEYAEDNLQGDERNTVYLSLLVNHKGTIPPRKVLVLAERGGRDEAFASAALEWLESKEKELNVSFTAISLSKEIPQGEMFKYHAVLQLNFPPYVWSDESERDFEKYVDGGYGGYIGFNQASPSVASHGRPVWNWFSDFMENVRSMDFEAVAADASYPSECLNRPVIRTNDTKRARNVFFQFDSDDSLFQNQTFLHLFENALHWALRDS